MPTLLRPPTREYRTVIVDSHRWDGYAPRDGDIIVATYPKCGTTWTQRIVDLLIFQSPAARPFNANAPWLDATFGAPIEAQLEKIAAQTHRRSLKSHLPFDSVPLYDGVKYIHVARDGRDACWSMHNHASGFTPAMRRRFAEEAAKDPRLRARGREPPADPRAFYLGWVAEAEADEPGGFGVDMPFFEFENTYWRERQRPNVLFVHYNDLKADLAGEMGRIAAFLEIETPESLFPELVEAATFETMKRQGQALLPNLAPQFDRGADRFINQGTNGRWRDVLTVDDLARYDALIRRKFTPSQARWIEHGRQVAGEPRTLGD